MHIKEMELSLPLSLSMSSLIERLDVQCWPGSHRGKVPVRFAITKSSSKGIQCAVSYHESNVPRPPSIFSFVRRHWEDETKFNVVFLVPTGIGAEIGGHAGDAGAAACLLAETCDTLVLHPNVVNASDINEMPSNAMYVEGSLITRMLMGMVSLAPVRSNRVLVILEDHEDRMFTDAVVNAVSAARASYGLNCVDVVRLNSPLKMKADFTEFGNAAGEVEGVENVFEILEEQRGRYDAVAISSVISVPDEYHKGYFEARGKMVNPWGGVEAMLTHVVSSGFNIQSAHSPMFGSRETADMETGIVDPRMAAEAISLTFFSSVLKGLHKSPRVSYGSRERSGSVSSHSTSALVIPDGCVGLPTLAALEQGIKVVAVVENRNLMENDLDLLPWKPGQFCRVGNYWEAAGVLCAIRAGIDPRSVRRPLFPTPYTTQGGMLNE